MNYKRELLNSEEAINTEKIEQLISSYSVTASSKGPKLDGISCPHIAGENGKLRD